MLDRADLYFHGGMAHADCTGMEEHDHEAHAEQDGEHAEHDEEHADASAEHPMDAVPDAAQSSPDPWQWLNQRLHAPAHRHLADTEFDELLPWIWAACRASPNSIQAYQIGDYVLLRQTGNPAVGIRLLKQGVAANPGSPDLAFTLGERYLNQMKQPEEAERWFEQALANNPLDGRPDDADAQILRMRTLDYLGHLAARRGDRERIRTCLAEAESINPQHQVVRSLKHLLDQAPP
jgi:tetratricopeptide (TPR) repeat protein